MSTIKNIFFVSYLKNKGVRRLCFILGILLAITPIYLWYEDLSSNFYNETYENILDFHKKPWNRYNEEKQKAVFNKYPIDVKFSSYHLDNFYEWQTFLTNQTVYTNRNDEKFVAFTICAI